jgi:hypothetical protein
VLRRLTLLALIVVVAGCGSRANRQVTHHDVLPTVVTAGVRVAQLPPTPRLIALARRWAGLYWHGTRCLGVTYHYHWLPPGRIAEANWSYNPDQPTRYLDCSVTFNRARMLTGFDLYCAAVVHEFGHLHGFHEQGGLDGGIHSRNPRNVMFPVLTARNIPAVCKRSTLP